MHSSTRLLLAGLGLTALAGALTSWWIAVAGLLVVVAVEVWRRSRTDRATGLVNRRVFRAAAEEALASGPRGTAILILDVAGADDRAMVAEFAGTLRVTVPAGGLPGRLSDDRFAVLLTDVDYPDRAYDVAGRIAAALGPVAVGGRLVTLAAAIGVAVAAPGEISPDELAHRAERAMLRAKSLGPDTRWAIWREAGEPGAGGAATPAAA